MHNYWDSKLVLGDSAGKGHSQPRKSDLSFPPLVPACNKKFSFQGGFVCGTPRDSVCALERAGRGTTSHILAVDTADLPWGPSRTSQESLRTPGARDSTNSWPASASFTVRCAHGCSNLCDKHCQFSHGTIFTQIFDYIFTSLSLFLMIKEILFFKLKTILKLLGSLWKLVLKKLRTCKM